MLFLLWVFSFSSTKCTFLLLYYKFISNNLLQYDRLFKAIDENEDGYLSHSELRALIVGIKFNEINLDEDDALSKVIKDFDTTLDSRVDLNEFIVGVGRWLEEARGKASNHAGSMKYIDEFHTVYCFS